MCDPSLTIGDLAEAGGVPRSTIRFYERAGLLQPTRRTASNYRQYDHRAVQRLRFIKAAQASGFTLEDIRRLIDLARQSDGLNERVQELIQERMSEIDHRLQELQELRDTLHATLEGCREGEGHDCCPVLERDSLLKNCDPFALLRDWPKTEEARRS